MFTHLCTRNQDQEKYASITVYESRIRYYIFIGQRSKFCELPPAWRIPLRTHGREPTLNSGIRSVTICLTASLPATGKWCRWYWDLDERATTPSCNIYDLTIRPQKVRSMSCQGFSCSWRTKKKKIGSKPEESEEMVDKVLLSSDDQRTTTLVLEGSWRLLVWRRVKYRQGGYLLEGTTMGR